MSHARARGSSDRWLTRIALALSIVAIAIQWIYSIRTLREGTAAMPDSVADLARWVCVKTAIVVVAVWGVLLANGERLADLGLDRDALKVALGRGILVAVGIFIAVQILIASLLAHFWPRTTPATLMTLFGDPRDAPLWIFAAIVGGGFTEELERAFVLTRVERWFGRIGLAAAVVIDSARFGLVHAYQGPQAILMVGIVGFVLALTFLRRRVVADAMVAHAVYDLLGITAAYALAAKISAP